MEHIRQYWPENKQALKGRSNETRHTKQQTFKIKQAVTKLNTKTMTTTKSERQSGREGEREQPLVSHMARSRCAKNQRMAHARLHAYTGKYILKD